MPSGNLTLLAIAGMLLAGRCARPANLVGNGSFEVGLKHWTYHSALSGKEAFSFGNMAIVPNPDSGTAAEGTTSCRISVPEGTFDPKTDRAVFWLASGLIRVKPDTTYTLSFSARSSIPVNIEARVYDGFKIYTHFINAPVSLGPEWKRFSFSGKSIGAYAWIEFANWKNLDGSWWVDAVQLEEGASASPFSPATSVEVGCVSRKEHNLYRPGEPLDLAIQVRRTGTSGPLDILFQTEEALTGAVVGNSRERLTFPGGTHVIRSLPYEVKTDRRGVFKTTVRALDSSDRTVDFDEYIYAVYDPLPPSDRFREDSIFAVDHLISGNNNRDSVEAYFRMARDIGVRWFRSEEMRFKYVCPQKGMFLFDDSLWRIADKYKVGAMVTLGVELGTGYIPKWARTDRYTKHPLYLDGKGNILPQHEAESGRTMDLDAWYAYCYESAKHFRGKVRYWEVLNESYGYPEYPDYLRTASKAIRAANPDAVVIANVMHCEKDMFIQRVKQEQEYNWFDVLSLHIYQYPAFTAAPDRFIPPLETVLEDFRKPMREAGAERPLWDTEGGYHWESYYTGRMNPPGFVDDMRTNHWAGSCLFPASVSSREQQVLVASYNTRRYVLYLQDKVGKFFYFVFNHLGVSTPYCSLLEYDDTPRLAYLAYGQTARMLENARPIRKLATGEKIQAYLFQDGGRLVTVIWNNDDRDAVFSFVPGTARVEAWDMVGNPVAPERRGRTLHVPVGAAPVYLVAHDIDAEVLARAVESGEPEGLVPLEFAVEFARDPASGSPAAAVVVRNTGAKPLTADFRIAGFPTEWTPVRSLLSVTGVKPGDTSAAFLPFSRVDAQEKPVTLRAFHRVGDEVLDTGKQFPRVALSLPAKGIRVDGVIGDDEWAGGTILSINRPEQVVLDVHEDTLHASTKAVTWKSPEDFSADIRTAWDQEALFIAARVRTRNFIQNKTEARKTFNSSCLEVFLSADPLRNAWGFTHQPSDYHLMFAPATPENPRVYQYAVREMNREFLLRNVAVASRQVPGGYEMEVRIPFENFEELRAVRDKAGLVLGFDIAVDGASRKGDRQYQMAWAGTGNNCARVDAFGRLILIRSR